MRPEVVLIVGPTAAGKTETAARLAGMLGSEVVSADSMAVYRGMDIGVDKPDVAMRRTARHHLIDVADPAETFSAGRYRELARPAIDDVIARCGTAIVAGGTGLYVRLTLYNITMPPPSDESVRAELEAELNGMSSAERRAGYSGLLGEDAGWENVRRLARQIEGCRASGGTSNKEFWQAPPLYGIAAFGIAPAKGEMERCVKDRIEDMLERGLVEEAERLLEKGLSRTASAAIGYAEAASFLAGEISRDEMREAMLRRTMRLAKRQMTWFNKEPGIEWLRLDDGSVPSPQMAADMISDRLGKGI